MHGSPKSEEGQLAMTSFCLVLFSRHLVLSTLIHDPRALHLGNKLKWKKAQSATYSMALELG